MALPLPVASLIDEYQIPGGLTLQRALPSVQNAYGGYDEQPPNNILVSPIAVHNLTGRDLIRGPDSDRNSEQIRVYTKFRIYVQDGGRAADVLLYQGRRWRAIQALDYLIQGACFISTFELIDVQTPVP